MFHRILNILPLFVALTVGAQELYIPPGAEVYVQGEGTMLTTTGELNNEGRLEVKTGSELVGLGNITNQGILFNKGTINLFSDFLNQNIFNTSEGGLLFQGVNNQTFTAGYLLVQNIEVNKLGTVTFASDCTVVTSTAGDAELFFTEGVITTDGSPFIVESDAFIIAPASGFDSYFEGELLSRGTANRIFPVGDGGYYGTIELINMRGTSNTEIGVSLIHQPSPAPTPGPEIIGVSDENAWVIDVRKGQLDSTQLQIDYFAEDLENFTNENTITADIQSPVIAQADSLDGLYSSLGVELLTNTDVDSTTMGILLAENYAEFGELGPKYFAVAWAPLINPETPIFIPNAFSPADPNPVNQVFRVHGENVAKEPFKVQVYNRFSILVFESNNFDEMNQSGWDGRNLRGVDEPTGVYYFYVEYFNKNDLENVQTVTGTVLLLR